MLKNLGFDMTSSAKKENGGTSEQEEIGETTGGEAGDVHLRLFLSLRGGSFLFLFDQMNKISFQFARRVPASAPSSSPSAPCF